MEDVIRQTLTIWALIYAVIFVSILFCNKSIAETSNFVRVTLPQCISIELPKTWMVASADGRILLDAFFHVLGLNNIDSELGFLAEHYDNNEQRLGSANVRYFPDAPITQKQVRTSSASDIATLDTYNRKGADLAIGVGGKISNWVDARLDTVNGILDISFGYDRYSPLFGEGVYHVDIFRVYDGPRSFSLTTSYLKSNAQIMEPLINHIKQSLKQECLTTDAATQTNISESETTLHPVDLSDLEDAKSSYDSDHNYYRVASKPKESLWGDLLLPLGKVILFILGIVLIPVMLIASVNSICKCNST